MLSPSSSSTCCVIPSASWEGGHVGGGRVQRPRAQERARPSQSAGSLRGEDPMQIETRRGGEHAEGDVPRRGAAGGGGRGARLLDLVVVEEAVERVVHHLLRAPRAESSKVKDQRSKDTNGQARRGRGKGARGAIGAMPGTDAAGCATRATPPHGRARRRRRQAGARATRAAPASCPSEPPASGTPVAPRRRPLGEPRAPARNRTQRARRRRARRGAGGRGTCLEHPAHLTHVHLGVHLPHRACHLPRRHGAVRHLGGSGRRECAARRCTTRVAPAGRRARSGAQGGPWRRWRPSACWTGRSSSKWRPPSPAARPPGRQRAGAHTLCGERRRSGEGPGPS